MGEHGDYFCTINQSVNPVISILQRRGLANRYHYGQFFKEQNHSTKSRVSRWKMMLLDRIFLLRDFRPLNLKNNINKE